MIRILQGDSRDVLKTLPDRSVHCCITSPPYFGLRDYGTAQWDGGDPACDHAARVVGGPKQTPGVGMNGHASAADRLTRTLCKCGARRIDAQIGLEASPDAYIAEMVAVFREVKRVLRDDGTLWLNLGSSYARDAAKGQHKPGDSGKHNYIIERGGRRASVQMNLAASDGKRPTQFPAPERVPACDSDDKESADYPPPDSSCRDQCDELLADSPSHRGRSFDSGLFVSQAAPPPSPTGHDNELQDCGAASPGVFALGGLRSSSLSSSANVEDASVLEDEALVSLPSPPTSSYSFQASSHTTACTDDTSGISDSSAHRSQGKSSLAKACNCGSCGICWAYLAIPLLRFKAKDLMDMPSLLALALQADGWLLRSKLPWIKRSTMPESCNDRPTSAIEYVYLLTKSGSATYWVHRDKPGTRSKPDPDYRWVHQKTREEMSVMPADWDTHAHVRKLWRRINLWEGRDYFWDAAAVSRQGAVPAGTRAAKGSNVRSELKDVNGRPPEYWDYTGTRNFRNSDLFFDSLNAPYGLICDADGNPLALDVNPAAYAESHFATFPAALVVPLVKASTSERGCCVKCGAPWVRTTDRVDTGRTQKMADGWDTGAGGHGTVHRDGREKGEAGVPVMATVTTGWLPSCQCLAAVAHHLCSKYREGGGPCHPTACDCLLITGRPVPCTVLDPFFGAGTTGLVSSRLGRDCVGIELSADYAAMARSRLLKDSGMFADISPE